MKFQRSRALFLPLSLLVVGALLFCSKKKSETPAGSPVFEITPQASLLTPSVIMEASGIADSKANPGYLWVEQDSGNPPEVYLVKQDGAVTKKIYLKNTTNRDWEDLQLAAGPQTGKNYLYIAETGDNNKTYGEYAFYRIEEPAAATDTVQAVDKIAFQYPDGNHDTEAFLVEPGTKDIWIITKTDNNSKLYKLVYPYSTTTTNSAVAAGELPYNYVVSAALSPDNKAIVLKTYTGINYYALNANETIGQALAAKPVALPYTLEPQGEAITFSLDNTGYYTLSEKGLGGTAINLYFYKRK